MNSSPEPKSGNKKNQEPAVAGEKVSPRGWSFLEATLKLPIKPTEHVRLVWQFFFCLAVIIVSYVIVLYLIVFRLDQALIVNQVLDDARKLSRSLRVAWDWNLSYRGVYVPLQSSDDKTPEEPPQADQAQQSGSQALFAKKSHADMTMEFAEIARTSSTFKFSLVGARGDTSRPPKDAWERSGINQLSRGGKSEVSEIVGAGRKAELRLLTPIRMESSCLSCHRQDGFKIGDVMGAFSVAIPVTAEFAKIRGAKIATALLYGVSLAILLVVISLLVMRLSSQLKLAYYHLEQLAREDPLTGLPNRRAFKEFTDIQVALSRRHGWPLTVIIADIDRFKSINDTYGHLKGDEVLRAMGSLIKARIRCSDVPCRWGGDEFVITLINTTVENGVTVAERLRRLFRTIEVKGVEKTLTCSFGLAQVDPRETLESAIARADTALFAVKNEGGDNWRIAEKESPSEPLPTK